MRDKEEQTHFPETAVLEPIRRTVFIPQEGEIEINEVEKNKVEIEVGFGGRPYFQTLLTEIQKDTLYIGIDTMGFKYDPYPKKWADVKGIQDLHVSVELPQEIESLVKGKIIFVLGDGKHLPFKAGIADKIIFKNVFNANPDEFFVTETERKELNRLDNRLPVVKEYKLKMAQEALRVLKDSGEIIIYTYTPEPEYELNVFLNGDLRGHVHLVEERVIKAGRLGMNQPLPIKRMYTLKKT